MKTRMRAIAVSGILILSFNFAGCFDWGGEPCKSSAAPAGEVICLPED